MNRDRRTEVLFVAAAVVALGSVMALAIFERRTAEPPRKSIQKPKQARVPDKYREVKVQLDTFQMTIPVGWERIQQDKAGSSELALLLRGPLFKGQNLLIAIRTIPIRKGVTLDGFVDRVTSSWPMQKFPVDRKIDFCNQDARMLGFTNEDGDNLVIMFVHKQTGYVIVSIAPEEQMPRCWKIFYDVLRGFQLYE